MSATEQSPAARSAYLDRPPPFILRSNFALGLLVLVIGVAALYSKSIAFLVFAVAFTMLFVPFAPAVTLAFFTVLLGACYFVSTTPVDVGPFKIYGVDALLALACWAAISLVVSRSVNDEDSVHRLSAGERSLLIWLTLWCAYGLFEMAYGFVEGYSYDLIFGDYRRYCFYMLGFGIVLYLPLRRVHLNLLPVTIIVGGAIILVICARRIVTGDYPVEQEDNATGYVYARLITLAEGGTLTLLLSYLTAFVLTTRKPLLRFAAIVMSGGALPLFILSGYRYLMGWAIITPVMTVMFLVWLRRSGFRPYFAPLILISFALLIAAVLLPVVLGNEFQKMVTDLSVRLQSSSATGEWRYWVWRQALEEFSQNVLIGRGFGHDLQILYRGSSGELQYIKASAHNTFLTVLYRGGIIGFVIFVAFHIKFYRYAIKNARTVPEEYQALYAALFVFTVAMIGNSLLQPFEVAQFVLLYMVMGLMLLLIRDGRLRALREQASC